MLKSNIKQRSLERIFKLGTFLSLNKDIEQNKFCVKNQNWSQSLRLLVVKQKNKYTATYYNRSYYGMNLSKQDINVELKEIEEYLLSCAIHKQYEINEKAKVQKFKDIAKADVENMLLPVKEEK